MWEHLKFIKNLNTEAVGVLKGLVILPYTCDGKEGDRVRRGVDT